MDSLHFTEQDEDPYIILGTTEDTSHEEASRIYRKLCKTWHPNKNSDAPRWAMAKITNAYTELYKHSQYDESWRKDPQVHEPPQTKDPSRDTDVFHWAACGDTCSVGSGSPLHYQSV
jgi:DnaJ-class molecular chaperone